VAATRKPAVSALNTCDRMILHAHDALRSMGYPGFLNQTHLWLGRRVEVGRLRRALTRLGRRHPVFVSRVSRTRRRPCWTFRAGDECTLVEASLDDAADDGVLRYAEALLAEPMDLSRSAPISFHLLHLPDGRDVFLVHNDHTLMDANGALPLVAEIVRLDENADERIEPTVAGAPDVLHQVLRRTPLTTRLRAVRYRRSVRSAISRHPTLTLVDHSAPHSADTRSRLAVRLLDERQTATFDARVRRLDGLPSPSMALLACALRAVYRLAGTGSRETARLNVTVGTNLRAGFAESPNFCNLASVLELSVALHEADDRDALYAALTRQLRERIQRGYDLGHLQVTAWFAGFRRLVRRRSLRRLTHDHSLIYGYVNWPRRAVDRLCEAPITRVHQPVGVWSPPGLALSATRFGGRLSLIATSSLDNVPEARVGQFLDGLVADTLA
jgi:hypothetical protein